MGKVDPTGFQAALATIQPGALSERQQRIAAGLAMIRDGESIQQAAVLARVPYSTLWAYHHKGQSVADREGKADYNVAAVTELSVDISLMAGERVRDSLAEHPEEWRPMDLVKAYGIATDKVALLSQRSTSSAHDALPALSKLLAGSKVTIEPSEQATTIEAERVD